MKPQPQIPQASDSNQGLFDIYIKSEVGKTSEKEIDIPKTKEAAKEMLRSLNKSDSAKEILKKLFRLLFGEEYREEEERKSENIEAIELSAVEKQALAKVLVEVLKSATGLDPQIINSIELMLLVLSEVVEMGGQEEGGIREKLADAFGFTTETLEQVVDLFDVFSSSEEKGEEKQSVNSAEDKRNIATIRTNDRQIDSWKDFLSRHSKEMEKQELISRERNPQTPISDIMSAISWILSANKETNDVLFRTAKVLSLSNKAHKASRIEQSEELTENQTGNEEKDIEHGVEISRYWRDKIGSSKETKGKFADRFKPKSEEQKSDSQGRN